MRQGILADHVRAALALYPRASHIEVTINSPGGTVKDAFEIYKMLRAHGAYITTIADDLCASAATIILMAGDLRQAWPESRLKIHCAATPETLLKRWTAAALRRHAEITEMVDQRILEIYTTRCGSRAFFERELSTEDYLPHIAARAFGVIHCYVGEEVWKNGRPYHF
jgi:ATP-dependent protease ClpP protease subunit